MSQKTSITKDETSCEPVFAREGDEVSYKIPVEGVVSAITDDATLTMAMYKEGSATDVSSTYFTGSMSVSGVDTILTKQTQNLKAGEYVISIKATIDGQLQVCQSIPYIVKRRSEL